ncbi:ABC transporter substrate-binding protein [Paenibacillus radicis (ex Gao et al. 2016)]|uniref:Ferrichrome ABC transporter substrate-binding protein n=1 Tax=Paenibacillus radicis (ex Gao et al. 2016) TaxID=1737354 RepID=A0A917HP29_9BACL|nr:ABC transporter substrate-binding protein [Paenibacillus radicis (ex Gao et al. 2016)]GGG85935.1 ferrichrome ABC transporter substrate-binding protein [Paenibacillus radicis (ex Gao et al. 2016)]
MRYKFRISSTFFLTALTILLLISGCGSKADNNSTTPSAPPDTGTETNSEPKEFKHELGSIQLDFTPQRIVAPYLEDALLTLGIKPAAKWSYGELVQDYLEQDLQDVPKLDFSGGGLNKEALLATNPDLVVLYTTNMADEEAYKQFSSIAPTYVFEDATVDWKKTLEVIGQMTGTSAKAEQAILDYDKKVVQAKEQLKPFVDNKTFAVIRVKPKEVQLMDGSYYSGLVLYSDLNLTPHKLVKELSWNRAQPLSLEILPQLDADYIFVLVQGEDSRALLTDYENSALWRNLPAVKNGQVFEMPSNYWMASGAIANTKKIDDILNALVK